MVTTLKLKRHVSLAPFTTYKIGGPADYFVEARSADELVRAVKWAKDQSLPFVVLGTGANVLISDQGFRGLVALNRAADCKIDGNRLKASSGAIVGDLIELSASHGLSGLEHFAGIPSSVGGAIWQNLHYLSPDRRSLVFVANVVESGLILDQQGRIRSVDADFFEFGYDDSVLQRRSITLLEATFGLQPAKEKSIRRQIAANLRRRRDKQPQLDEFPSCGSVFRKIEGIGAGRLIDQTGLKGLRVGHAQVSPKHANYIVNLGGATAAEVRALISKVQSEIKDKTGYWLEPEVSFVGEW